MAIQAITFYLFAGIVTLSAIMVITARNPVHSVLFLILAFFSAAGLFVLLGAEFIAMILIIVYVGAVAVLFLFVVMMLDIDFQHLRKGAMQYVPLGLMIGAVLLSELYLLYKNYALGLVTAAQSQPVAEDIQKSAEGTAKVVTNTEALGHVLYTDYAFAFELAGLILFVAMIGAIVLTHRTRPGVRKQSVSKQYARKAEDVLEIRHVSPGTGV